MAMDDVEADQNDFSSQVRWANAWQSSFFALYCMVMLVSLFLFLCLLRAMARHTPKKETPLYFFIVFIFFTGLVEDALIIQQFIMVNVPTAHTTTLCQFFTYVVYGNKILTAVSVLSLLLYTWIAVTLKRTVIEQTAKKYFPHFVLGLFVLELILMIEPTLNVRANASQQFCYHVDKRFSTRRRVGWLYLVLYPYFIPILLSIFPLYKLAMKIKERALLSMHVAQVRITVVIVIGYYFFYLLYYTLMLGRETEALLLDRSHWRKLLGKLL